MSTDPQTQECPVPGAHELHEKMKLRPALSNFAVESAATLFYYSTPDWIHSRVARFCLKNSVAGGLIWYAAHQEPQATRDTLSALAHFIKQDGSVAEDKQAGRRDVSLSELQSISREEWETSAQSGTPFGTTQNGLGQSQIGAVNLDDSSEGGQAEQDGQADQSSSSAAALPGGNSTKRLALFAGIGVAATVASVTTIAWVEKAIFRRGERLRLAGRSLPHTRQAAALALVSGLAAAAGKLIPAQSSPVENSQLGDRSNR